MFKIIFKWVVHHAQLAEIVIIQEKVLDQNVMMIVSVDINHHVVKSVVKNGNIYFFLFILIIYKWQFFFFSSHSRSPLPSTSTLGGSISALKEVNDYSVSIDIVKELTSDQFDLSLLSKAAMNWLEEKITEQV